MGFPKSQIVSLKELQKENSIHVVKHIFSLYDFIRTYLLRSSNKDKNSIPYIKKKSDSISKEKLKSTSKDAKNKDKQVLDKKIQKGKFSNLLTSKEITNLMEAVRIKVENYKAKCKEHEDTISRLENEIQNLKITQAVQSPDVSPRK